jgi:hypothetical protein
MSRWSGSRPTLSLTQAGREVVRGSAAASDAVTKPHLGSPLSKDALPRPLKLDPKEIQRLWFALLKRPWRSLVLASANSSGNSWEIAEALAEVGQLHWGTTIKLMDAEGAALTETASLVAEMTTYAASGKPVFVAVGSLVENLAGVPLVHASDAVILCVTLGAADFDNARRTVELIGADRILGCVALRRG